MANEFVITDVVSKEALAQLDGLKARMERARSAYAALAADMAGGAGTAPRTFDELSDKAAAYASRLDRLNKTEREMADTQKAMLNVLRQVSSQLNQIASLDRLKAMFRDLAASTRSASEELAGVSASASEAAASQQRAAEATARAARQLDGAEAGYDEIIRTVREFDGEAERLSRVMAANRVEMDGIRATAKELAKEYRAGKLSAEEYAAKLAEQQRRTAELSEENKRNAAMLRNHAAVATAATGSYYEMNAAMLELQKRFKGLDEAGRNSAAGQDLLRKADTLNGKLKEIDAQLGNYQRNVGNYSSAWNGLGMSVQQIARELPSLAMGWNTFFLAISNNLPMLTDELKRARDEYNALKQAGRQATPVWRQLLSSVVSWQTLLVAGITVLSLYGKEIMEWAGSLFEGEKAARRLVNAENELASARLRARQSAAAETMELDTLYRATQDVSRSMEERTAAVDELQRKYPAYFQNLSREEILAGGAAASYGALRAQLVATARAKAYLDRITELENKRYEAEIKRWNKYNDVLKKRQELQRLEQRLEKYLSGGGTDVNALSGYYNMIGRVENELEELEKQWESLKKVEASYSEAQEAIMDNIKVTDLLADPDGDDKELEQEARRQADYLEGVARDLAQSRLDIMREGEEKELAQIRADYQRKAEAITGGSRQETELRANLQALMERDMEEVRRRYADKRAEAARADLANRIAALGTDSDRELEARLALQLEASDALRRSELDEARRQGIGTAAIEEKYRREQAALLMDYLEERAGLIRREADAEREALDVARQRETNEAKRRYAEGQTSREEHEREMLAISLKYSRLRLQLQLEEARKELEISGLTDERRAQLQRRADLLQAQIEGLDLDAAAKTGSGGKKADGEGQADGFLKALRDMRSTASRELGQTADLFAPLTEALEGIGRTAKKLGKDMGEVSFKEFWDNLSSPEKASLVLGSLASISSGISGLVDDMLGARIDALDEEQEANQEAYEQEVERIERLQEAGAISSEEAEARKRAAEDKTRAKEEEIARKKQELEQKQARWDKANSIVQATIATALAVTKALPNFVVAAIVAAMGAAQVALIAAQPIPKYARGTRDHPGGPAIVGDGGRPEAVLTPQGGVYATPSRPTLVELPAHSQVVPDLSWLTDRRGLGSDYPLLERRLREEGEGGLTVNVVPDNGGMERRMDGIASELARVRKLLGRAARRADWQAMYRRV